jgi:starch phosphorylase
VRESMARLAPQYSANRMLEQYLGQYYVPGAASYRARGAGGAPGTAAEIEAWRRLLDEHWSEIEFVSSDVRPSCVTSADTYTCRVDVRLGSIPPEAIRVELYAEPIEGAAPDQDGRPPVFGAAPPEIHVLAAIPVAPKRDGSLPDSYTYTAVLPVTRPIGDYTPRVVPWHVGTAVPLEANHILWHG